MTYKLDTELVKLDICFKSYLNSLFQMPLDKPWGRAEISASVPNQAGNIQPQNLL